MANEVLNARKHCGRVGASNSQRNLKTRRAVAIVIATICRIFPLNDGEVVKLGSGYSIEKIRGLYIFSAAYLFGSVRPWSYRIDDDFRTDDCLDQIGTDQANSFCNDIFSLLAEVEWQLNERYKASSEDGEYDITPIKRFRQAFGLHTPAAW